MTTSEDSRKTVLLFCDCLSRRDFSAMAELMTFDATWWVVGRPDYVSHGGLHQVESVMQLIDSFLGSLDEFSFTVESSIADGDLVAIEATSSGRKGAAIYKNVYLMRYHLRDRKIQSIREFMDPFEITEFLKQLSVDVSVQTS